MTPAATVAISRNGQSYGGAVTPEPTADITVPGRADITRAAERIAGKVRRTPVIDYRPDDLRLDLTLKLELLQHAGSFKPRGAFNTVLAQIEAGHRPAVLVAASGGNHGMAVAYVGHALGIPTEIFVPATAPVIKVDAIRRYGAHVTLAGAHYAEAFAASAEAAARPDRLAVHAYDSATTVAGQGTIAVELAAQADVDTVVVAVGGGGLIGGIAAWCADPDGGGARRAKVVGVEPTSCPTMNQALAAGEPVDVEVSGVAADALGARRLGAHPFAAVTAAAVQSVLVRDEQIIAARRRLWADLRLSVEPAAAAGLAALVSGAYQPEPGERIAVVICGANADPSDLSPSELAGRAPARPGRGRARPGRRSG